MSDSTQFSLFDSSDDKPAKASTSKRKVAKKTPRTSSSDDAISISELTRQIKSTVEAGFPAVWVAGEITDIARPRSGHLYFTLKDDRSQIRGVMWRSVAERLAFELDDGQSVLCMGDVEVYAARGSYQLVVRKCQPQGIGALQLAFAQLQAKLQAEGLFEPERKRLLPRVPRRVAIVTSPTGAAIQDFLQAAAQRHAGIEIVLIPASVQGPGSVESLIDGMRAAHRMRPQPDVLIISRGGGSLEDLWSFNDEQLVRAIAASRIPTVSAVGHEIDVTLADLVADVRALTPTDAASRVLPDRDSMVAALDGLGQMMTINLFRRIQSERQRLENWESRPVFQNPFELVHDRSRELDDWDERGRVAIWRRLEQAQAKLATTAAAQSALSPLAVLSRGYSVTQTKAGQVVRSAGDAQPGDTLRTRLSDGDVFSVVSSHESNQGGPQ